MKRSITRLRDVTSNVPEYKVDPFPPINSSKSIILIGSAQEETEETDDTQSPPPAPYEWGLYTGSVIFDVQPNVTESGSANYIEIGDIRQAASLLIYTGSPSRTFSIDATFVSRSIPEALQTLEKVNLLKSWRMPEKKKNEEFNVNSPSRLFLTGLNKQFNMIPVRMTDLTIPLTEETDYIDTGAGSVPIIWNISITLKEARSIQELQKFNIQKFREGKLDGW